MTWGGFRCWLPGCHEMHGYSHVQHTKRTSTKNKICTSTHVQHAPKQSNKHPANIKSKQTSQQTNYSTIKQAHKRTTNQACASTHAQQKHKPQEKNPNDQTIKLTNSWANKAANKQTSKQTKTENITQTEFWQERKNINATEQSHTRASKQTV